MARPFKTSAENRNSPLVELLLPSGSGLLKHLHIKWGFSTRTKELLG